MAKSDTFRDWRESESKKKLRHLRNALKILSTARYENITGLAKSAAGIMTEFMVQENNALPEDRRKENVLPVSYTTLLRNKTYKVPLEVAFSGSGAVQEVETPSVDEIILLKAKNASLESEISNLRVLVNRIDAGDQYLIEDKSNDEIAHKTKQIKLLIRAYEGMQEQAHGAFSIVNDESKLTNLRPVLGVYGPFGLLLTWDELLEIQKIQEEYK